MLYLEDSHRREGKSLCHVLIYNFCTVSAPITYNQLRKHNTMAMPTHRSASLATSPSPLTLMIDGEKEEEATIDVTSAQKQLQKGLLYSPRSKHSRQKSALLLAPNPEPEPAPRCLSPDTGTNSRSFWGTANTGQRLPDDLYLYLGVDINHKWERGQVGRLPW